MTVLPDHSRSQAALTGLVAGDEGFEHLIE
jgi:hypothetical protein